ncbi:glycosyltransferase family 2 protein [Rufibacter hautae]|uniref:Glycosyltransferase family 2 protein n=1 Tax=Rufibacter hautae TaxID=2595005 RepID=A0A5B6TDX6_9BACT|nr:glycosyltransferase family 2 protein [Rufibacter hautae]KAA3437584.1 glycosyltransferase family 2 protein [Rufibacter hautae]
MQPLVSIVLPTYNGQEFIKKAVESCLAQTYSNIELIIVNDCSNDGTISIIESYFHKDSRIKVVTNQVNHKLPKSLNIGFSVAKGDYFTWISDDNIFGEKAIETLVGYLDRNDRVDIIYSSYHYIDSKGKKIDSFGAMPEELVFKCSPGACFLYKREVHEELDGYDEHRFRMEDMDFWLRAATRFTFKYIDNKDLYYYRKHQNNLTSGIFSNQDLYLEYRNNHLASFKYFFKNGLDCEMTNDELVLHLELYFEDISINKNWDFSISDKVVAYIEYLDKLKELAWNRIGFDESKVKEVIKNKKDKVVKLVINDLFFENQILHDKKLHLANQFNKPISWYYKEYEVLPAWYKKVGHIIKVLQGNRPWKSLMSNQGV